MITDTETQIQIVDTALQLVLFPHPSHVLCQCFDSLLTLCCVRAAGSDHVNELVRAGSMYIRSSVDTPFPEGIACAISTSYYYLIIYVFLYLFMYFIALISYICRYH